jgi:serine-type D-Ala-D-Ala carboxypeptidase/endopeptidase (penicillin-binding protein 4)
VARPETHPGVEGGGVEEGADASGSPPPADVVRPGTGVVRPGTGVVRPGTGVVRPGTASPTDAATAKASAAIPEAPEKPLEPIHVVLPVIPLKPAKQGFLDRLVAPKPKKTEAELAEEEAQRRVDEARKAEEAQRKADEAQRKAEAQARKAAEEATRTAAEARAKADAKARSKAEEDARKAEEDARKAEEKARKAEEKARRAEAKAKEKAAREDEDEDDEEDEYDEPASPPRGFAGPAAPSTSPPVRQAPPGPGGPTAPPRPGQAPTSPPRPGARPGAAPGRPFPPSAPPTGRPQRAPDRRSDYDDRRSDYEARPARRPLRHWIAAAVALVALGGGSAAITGVAVPPGTVRFAEGIDTGDSAPILSGLSANAPRPTVGGVAAAIGPLFADAALGGRVAGSIVDVLTGDPLYDVNGATAMTPASAAKLLTAAAVLHTRGPNYRIATRAVAGSSPGEVVLVAGGDPTLAAGATMAYRGAARLDLLAEQVRKALGGTTPTRVIIDTSIYQGSTTGPGWAEADVKGGIISNITALMTDGARVNPADTRSNAARYVQPDAAAGQLFAQALGLPATAVISGVAPQGAKVLGEVFSPTIARIVEVMLVDSDNVVAEAMARQAALAKKLPGTFAGGAQATQAALTELGVNGQVILVDGSGLSDDNRVTTNQLAAVLYRAASPKYPQLRAIMSGLPVAGYSGTLVNRDQGSGMGSVRAKTGTLNHVNALAGYVVDKDGRLLAFAAVADATTNRFRAESALDRLAAGIASCGCR